jgi:cytochrome c oxidase assembly factor CtaG
VFLLRASNWPVEWPLAAIAVVAFLYAVGGRQAARPQSRRRSLAFYGGLATVAIAIDSPVDAYADTLFWVHMLQHVLLMMVAPPLILLGRPWPRVSKPLPLGLRRPVARTVLAGATLSPLRRAGRWLASPLPAFALFNGTLLVWHLPALYDLTLRNGTVHDLEHALFFSTALLFWVHLVPGASGRPQLSDGARAAYATGGLLVSWVLALVLGFAPDSIYSAYSDLQNPPGGLSALADQQLAAGVMWVPGSIPYVIAIFVAAYRWLDPAGATRRRHTLRPRET